VTGVQTCALPIYPATGQEMPPPPPPKFDIRGNELEAA
jgi:hypothetical protein